MYICLFMHVSDQSTMWQKRCRSQKLSDKVEEVQFKFTSNIREGRKCDFACGMYD